MIVIGTLFVYIFALSDDNMSRREQTMVSGPVSVKCSMVRVGQTRTTKGDGDPMPVH